MPELWAVQKKNTNLHEKHNMLNLLEPRHGGGFTSKCETRARGHGKHERDLERHCGVKPSRGIGRMLRWQCRQQTDCQLHQWQFTAVASVLSFTAASLFA